MAAGGDAALLREIKAEQERMAVAFANQIAGLELALNDRIKAHEVYVQREFSEFQKRIDEAEVGRTALKWMSTVSELRVQLGAQKAQAAEELSLLHTTLGAQQEQQKVVETQLAEVVRLRMDVEQWWSSHKAAADAPWGAPAKQGRPSSPGPSAAISAGGSPHDSGQHQNGWASADAALSRRVNADSTDMVRLQELVQDQCSKLTALEARIDVMMDGIRSPEGMRSPVPGDLTYDVLGTLGKFQDCSNEEERRALFDAILEKTSRAEGSRAEASTALPPTSGGMQTVGSASVISSGHSLHERGHNPPDPSPGSSVSELAHRASAPLLCLAAQSRTTLVGQYPKSSAQEGLLRRSELYDGGASGQVSATTSPHVPLAIPAGTSLPSAMTMVAGGALGARLPLASRQVQMEHSQGQLAPSRIASASLAPVEVAVSPSMASQIAASPPSILSSQSAASSTSAGGFSSLLRAQPGQQPMPFIMSAAGARSGRPPEIPVAAARNGRAAESGTIR